MGQLVMSFRGLTMHVTKASKVLPANVQHRVVPVNASSGFKGDVKDWGCVPPHHCFLEFSEEAGKALLAGRMKLDHSKKHISLHGWSVTLINPAGSRADVRIGGVPDDIPRSPGAPPGVEVPHLKEFLPSMVLKEGIAGAYVPDWAACFVDINSGTVTARKFRTGAIYTTWSVETKGDPRLQFTRLLHGLVPETLTIEIPSTPPLAHLAHDVPGSMVVHNGTADESDKEFDFVLHFLANADGVPTKNELAKQFPIDPPPTAQISMTTSCSNSQYP
ncbi:MAG: hypothetical protein M3P06_01455 [Acidobacteriota bacterium]|nr:hypothetical protein [Acidobacteriota bacterium]